MKSIDDLLPRPDETERGWKKRVEAAGYKVVKVGESGYGVTLGDDMKMPGIPHDEEKGRPEKVTRDVAESRTAREEARIDENMRAIARDLAEGLLKAEEMYPEEDVKESFVLDQAKSIVYGPRQHMYGHASTNFRRTARLWEVIFGVPVTDLQVGLAMIQLKVARIHNLVEREAQGGAPATFDEIEDGFKDIAGYAEATMRARFEDPSGRRFK